MLTAPAAMDHGSSYYVRRHDRIHGPFTREDLRELAGAGHIDGATGIATARDGPWSLLDTLPELRGLLTKDQPPEFERANHAGQPPIDLADVIAAANRPRARPAGPVPAAETKPVSAPHDVHSILRFNREIEKRHGLHELKPLVPRRSKRRRDYLEIMAIIGVVIFCILFVESYVAVNVQVLAARMPGQFWPVFKAVVFHSPIFVWGLACYLGIAAGLGWIMFGLMDDY